MRRSFAAAAALATVLAPGTPAAGAPADPDTSRIDGADLVAVSLSSGKLRTAFRDTAGRSADPGNLRFTTSAAPVGRIPGDPAFAFLGEPGSPVWTLSDAGSGLPAIDVTGVKPGQVSDGVVTLDAEADGPGAFAAYTLSRWGRPTLLLDSNAKTSARVPAGRRLGGLAWAFDAPGDYRITLHASARTDSGTVRDESTYAVTVPGPGASSTTAAVTEQRAVAATTAPTSAAAAAAARKVIADGHVDMGPQLAGSTLTIRLKDDAATPPTWRNLADVTLKATDKAKIDVPGGSAYAFLGRAGDQVYLLPQSQQAGIVWPGWNTQHESVVGGTRGDVVWSLQAVSGPGQFKLFRTGSFGTPEVIFDSANKLPQQLAIPPNTHAHGNWAFTKAGRYDLTVRMSATTTAGRTVSDTRTLSFAIGDGTGTGAGSSGGGEDDSEVPGGEGLAKTGANVMSVAGAGALLLVAGIGTVVLSRRRRDQRHQSTPDAS